MAAGARPMSARRRLRLGTGLMTAIALLGCSAAPGATPSPTSSVTPSTTATPTSVPSPAPPTPAGSEGSCAGPEFAAGTLVFSVGDGQTNGIATLNVDGSGYSLVVDAHAIAGQPHGGTEAPTWIGASRILFDSNRSGGPDAWHLFTVEPGKEPRKITDGDDGIEYHGALAPDGSTLVYGKAVATGDAAEPLRDAGLFTAGPDGRKERQLTTAPPGGVDEWPDFSPDGQRIAFSRANAGAGGGILVIDVDGGGVSHIVPGELQPIRPRWSPDGQWIAFSTNADRFESASANVWVVRVDGTDLRQVTFESRGGQAYYPSWSPDGAVLMFVHHRAGGGSNDLAAIPFEGGDRCTIRSGSASAIPFEGDWR